ncbi:MULTISPECIES: DNA topoisomerase [Burkholderia cepacia complex]|nr:DNA topoisomerase [Burkholderia cepacia]
MSYQVGQKLTGGVARLRETETTPPKRFNDGTLITAMTNIHRFVSNEADRKVLRDTKGIGTDRTRDAIIETLRQRKYVVRGKGGYLEPTNLGIELIQRLPRELSDPVTTAKWEMALGLIEQGKMTRQQFDVMIRGNATKLVDALKSVKFDLDRMGIKAAEDKPRPEVDETLPGHGDTCEKCNKGQMVGKRLPSGKKVVGCSNFPSCKHSKWID